MKLNDSSLVIIDTSALIEANQNPTSLLAKQVRSLIEIRLAAITPVVLWELGRGRTPIRDRVEFLDYLDSLELLDWKMNWEEFSEFDEEIRKKGFMVPLSDLWISKTAIEHKCFLAHRDKHYTYIAQCSNLRLWNPS